MATRAKYHHGDLRTALVDAALELIAEHGLEALSVAEAARRTGVSAAAPYRHFPTRGDLLRAAAIRAAELLVTDLRAAVARATCPGEQLAETARAYVRFVIEHHAGLDLIFDARLRVGDQALAEAGRAVMNVLLPVAMDITGDAHAALDLLEKYTAAAHGYAALHLSGFLRGRAPEVETIADRAAEISAALTRAAGHSG
ncbi:TetR/AcrR family transcriptional regulator [Actinophytocola oryzae]|uniref:TetR family transcriptional regulator n=1 Tax=Actinophytocola oryzae TaxID=502181 RepID=A0A4R7W1B1_9PSEU|nr:TetR/AcrR family transcriptional regulator [Actinophytocola oryzae]TDV55317.1 TetR family transcriptional regulator [Actinophytocola oryzae]